MSSDHVAVMSFDHVFTIKIPDCEVNVISFDHLVDVVGSDHVFAVLSYLRSCGCVHELRTHTKFSRAPTLYQCTQGHTKDAVSKLATFTFLLIRLGHEAETS
jgi:hypothetical protein